MSARWQSLLCVGCALLVAASARAGDGEKTATPVLEKQREVNLKARWLAFNHKGTELAACVGSDVVLLDPKTCTVQKTFIAAGKRVAYALDDRFLVLSGVFQSGIELMDRGKGESTILNYGENDFKCHSGLNLLAYHGRSKNGPTINLYDLAKKKVVRTWEIDDSVSRPEMGGFSEKGVLLASFTKDRVKEGKLVVMGYLLVWPPPYDSDPIVIECEKEAWSLAISADGRHAGVGTGQGTTDIWDLKTRKRLQTLNHSHLGPVEAVAFSPDGRLFASLVTDSRTRRKGRPRGKGNSEVILWDVKARRERGTIEVSKELTTALVFFPDGKHLATAGEGGIIVWKIHADEPRGK